jgi:hypothetical protein
MQRGIVQYNPLTLPNNTISAMQLVANRTLARAGCCCCHAHLQRKDAAKQPEPSSVAGLARTAAARSSAAAVRYTQHALLPNIGHPLIATVLPKCL